jgi:hypothetical protein
MSEEGKEREEKAPVGDQQKGDEKSGGLNAHFKKHWYLYAAGFGAAVLVISIISLKAKANAAQGAGATDPSAVGYTGHVDTMAGGFPDTSNYDSVMSMLNGLNSAEAQNYTLLGQLAKGQTPTQPAPTTSDPSTQTNPIQTWVATIRAKMSNPGTNSYDVNHPEGIPIRSTPSASGKVIGYEPYGSSQQFIGTPVSGGSNFAKGATGSSLWEKTTSGGYVSMYDIRS